MEIPSTRESANITTVNPLILPPSKIVLLENVLKCKTNTHQVYF